jgi:hypothetical protein
MAGNDQSNGDAEDVHQDEAASEQTPRTIEQEMSSAIDKMKGHHLKMIEIAQANADSAFDFARQLATAKTPSEIMELCIAQARQQFENMAEETEEMTELEEEMPKSSVYIEARPKGRPEFDSITDFVVEDDADRVLGAFDTQMEAILWAKEAGHDALVTRARHLNDKNIPEHWRAF